MVSSGICATCGQDNVSSVCRGCRSVHYCDRDCQRKDWPTHKPTCLLLPSALRGVKFGMGEEDVHLNDIPIFKACKKIDVQSTHSIYWKLDMPTFDHLNRTLKGIADRNGGVINMDCMTWVQLYLSACDPTLTSTILCMGDNGLFATNELTKGCIGLNPGYLCVADHMTHERSMPWLGASRGQCLIGPDSSDRYIGLSSDGPLRITLKEWHERLFCGVKERIEQNPGNRIPSRPLDFLQTSLRDGGFDFDKYTFIRETAIAEDEDLTQNVEVECRMDRLSK